MMKALSLWQPWASFIAIGVKPFETRAWPPPLWLIGQRIAIHAAKKLVSEDDREWARRCGAADLPLGAIVCTAILRGAYQCGVTTIGGAYCVAGSVPLAKINVDEFGNYGMFRWAWLLTDIERIEPPIPARGARKLWDWHG